MCTCMFSAPAGWRGPGRWHLRRRSWHIHEVKARTGTDVSGRTITILTDIPGNILDGNWKVVVYVDDGASALNSSRRCSMRGPASSGVGWRTSRSSSAR